MRFILFVFLVLLYSHESYGKNGYLFGNFRSIFEILRLTFNKGGSNNDKLNSINLKNWMSNINDDKNLLELSIPGTHNSLATRDAIKIVNAYWTAFWQTQVMSLQQQLEHGIRFLDIRCRHIRDSLSIHHGIIYLGIWLPEVLDIVEEFLKREPTETVVMNIQEEDHLPERDGYTFIQVLKDHLQERDKTMYYRKRMLPSFGEVRGKIVLSIPSYSIGIDRYEQNMWGKDLFTKKDLITSHLIRCNEFDSLVRLCVNWINIENNGIQPIGFTSNILNNHVRETLENNNYHKVGTIVMDNPTEPLIRQIIGLNF